MSDKPLPIRFPTDDEIPMMVRQVAASLRGLMGAAAAPFEGGLEFLCRFSPLGKALAAARERHGLDLRDAARRSGLRQKDVRAIETHGAGDIVPWLVGRYAAFLGMGRYLAAWREANPKLAAAWSAQPAPKMPEPGEQLPEPELSAADFDAGVLPAGLPSMVASDEEEQPLSAPAGKPVRRKPASKPGAPALWQMKVTLRYIQPPIWRRIEVPNTMTLDHLHTVIQIAMGWTDSHLHSFTLGDRRTGKRFGVPTADDWREVLDEQDHTLASLGLRPKGKLSYEYDFGDGWEHDIVLEKVLPCPEGEAAPPRCTGGGRACPPEDCGSYPGYMHFCEVALDRKHPEYRELVLDWHGGAYDPEKYDAATADRELAAVFQPRKRRSRRRWML